MHSSLSTGSSAIHQTMRPKKLTQNCFGLEKVQQTPSQQTLCALIRVTVPLPRLLWRRLNVVGNVLKPETFIVGKRGSKGVLTGCELQPRVFEQNLHLDEV